MQAGRGPARALRAFVEAVDLADARQAAVLQNLVRTVLDWCARSSGPRVPNFFTSWNSGLAAHAPFELIGAQYSATRRGKVQLQRVQTNASQSTVYENIIALSDIAVTPKMLCA